ncbi:MAG: hypothetical protein NTW87_22910 [Planctomycetota bacterium]|nr:hypothetical protein [Planctomycetota bacterium]
MTYHGKVQNGVVVLDKAAMLPDGTAVTVAVGGRARRKVRGPRRGDAPRIWKTMLELAKWAETLPCSLPEDLARNHDHYLHGLPKKK